MNKLLAQALADRGRTWGEFNTFLKRCSFAFQHGSPAFKRSGAGPVGATSARPRAVVRGLDWRTPSIRVERYLR